MNEAGRALLPWAHRSGAYAVPTSILVRMRLGEAPEHIPSLMDVRQRAAPLAEATGLGDVDRVVSTFGGAVRVSRVHAAATALRNAGNRNRGFTEAEELSGISRVLRFDVAPGTHVGSLAISLMQLANVESAIPNYVCTVGLDGEAPPGFEDHDDGWDPRTMIGAAEALAREPGDPAIIVGIVDTGLATGHREFEGRVRRGFDTVQLGRNELAGGVELLGDTSKPDTNPVDNHVGHGSGCAGIIGALGLDMPPGLAGESQILPVRSLGAARMPGKKNAIGIGAISDLDMGLVLAIQLGARVCNMSFGTDDEALEPGAPKPHSEAVAFARERGCILVAASGNSGDARTYWPAADPDVIAVGSVDANGQASSFSTTGDHVAIAAPGERIKTAGISGYQRATGTSFAAPFAAATAALLLARAQRRSAPLDAATIKDLMIQSATPHHGSVPPGNGAGVLNAGRALHLLDAALDADESTEVGGEDDG